MMQCFPPVGANSLAALVLTHCLTASKQTHNGVTMTTSQWRFGGLGALLSSLVAGRCVNVSGGCEVTFPCSCFCGSLMWASMR